MTGCWLRAEQRNELQARGRTTQTTKVSQTNQGQRAMPRVLFESAAGCLACLLALQTAAYPSPPRHDVGLAFRHPYRVGDPQLCEPTRWTFNTRGRTAHRPCWPNVWTCRPPEGKSCLERP